MGIYNMRTKKTVVILVSGKAGSGKTTVADKLIEKLKKIPSMDVMDYGFADPLKFIAKAYGGWNGEKDQKGRKLLQDIGRIFREYDKNIWVKHFLNQLDKQSGMFPKNFVIIDDWRFPDELSYLKTNPLLDIVTIRIFGRQGDLSDDNWKDISENSLPEVPYEALKFAHTGSPPPSGYNITVDNSCDLELLDHKLEVILAEIEKQYIVE